MKNKKDLILLKLSYIILSVDTESCPSWSKEHDWKSCKLLKRFRGFESLALRQVTTATLIQGCGCDCQAKDENPRFYRGKKKALVKIEGGELQASHKK